jgi:hypothetical protein
LTVRSFISRKRGVKILSSHAARCHSTGNGTLRLSALSVCRAGADPPKNESGMTGAVPPCNWTIRWKLVSSGNGRCIAAIGIAYLRGRSGAGSKQVPESEIRRVEKRVGHYTRTLILSPLHIIQFSRSSSSSPTTTPTAFVFLISTIIAVIARGWWCGGQTGVTQKPPFFPFPKLFSFRKILLSY